MSKVLETNYNEEFTKGYNLRTAYEEASRCLMCHDSPCSKGCPANTNPGKFIRSIKLKNIKGAIETVRENNPLAGCCSLVCPYDKLCEQACSRTGIDKPIEIGRLQHFLVESEKSFGMEVIKPVPLTKGNVLCIGAGPASLACASMLAREGYAVTIYEAAEKAGGVLTQSILPSRLPESLADFDISLVEKLGVKFEFNKKVSAEDLAALKSEFDAVFLGIGLSAPKVVDVVGNDLDGVYYALDYLKETRSCTEKEADDVIVIGGGDVAMDCVVAAKQLGSKNAKIVYRRTVAEAPANVEEIHLVGSMGIPMFTEFAPDEIIGENGKVAAMKFKGRDGFSSLTVKADKVIFAIGQAIEGGYDASLVQDNVFAGGDFISGGKTVVEAVADGKVAAEKIMEYISK